MPLSEYSSCLILVGLTKEICGGVCIYGMRRGKITFTFPIADVREAGKIAGREELRYEGEQSR